LDVSENSLNDAGLIVVCEVLVEKKNIHHLIFNGNFEKKTKSRPQAIHNLISVLGSESSSIETLHIQGNSKALSLKEDIMPFIFSLMANRKLKELDISGNQIGNALALGLLKVLLTNRTLESILLNDNLIGFPGFQMIRQGLAKNHVLKNMPLPLEDISNMYKEKPGEQSTELIKSIQELLFANCVEVATEEVEEKEADKHQRPVRALSNLQNSSQNLKNSSSGTGTVSIASHKSAPKKSKTGTLRHMKNVEQLEMQMEEGEKKKHTNNVMKHKPSGIDTLTASAMLGQLNEYMKTKDDE